MTEPAYFKQADQELEELNRKRRDFMTDTTPVCNYQDRKSVV